MKGQEDDDGQWKAKKYVHCSIRLLTLHVQDERHVGISDQCGNRYDRTPCDRMDSYIGVRTHLTIFVREKASKGLCHCTERSLDVMTPVGRQRSQHVFQRSSPGLQRASRKEYTQYKGDREPSVRISHHCRLVNVNPQKDTACPPLE